MMKKNSCKYQGWGLLKKNPPPPPRNLMTILTVPLTILHFFFQTQLRQQSTNIEVKQTNKQNGSDLSINGIILFINVPIDVYTIVQDFLQ